MKKILLVLILLISISAAKAQVKFDALQVTPQMPKAGQTVSFKYNTQLSPLIDEKKVEVVVYVFGKKGPVAMEPKITKTGNVYSGTLKLDSTDNCIVFSFSSSKEKDNNAGNGYIIPVYANNSKPVMEYFNVAGSLYSGYGEYLFGMNQDANKNLTILEEGFTLYPDSKKRVDYISNYLYALNSAKKKEAEPIILEQLKTLSANPDIKESDFGILAQWYNRLKMKGVADSFRVIMKEKFPSGNWVKQEMAANINKAKDADAKKTAFETYVKAYPPIEEDKQTINNYKSQVASAYQKAKNYIAFYEWSKDLPAPNKGSLYNNTSWYMALDSTDIAEAKKLSYEATTWAKKEMMLPTEKKQESLTKKQWDKQRKSQYAMYADTYSFILYKTGDYKNGYQYAKEAANINEFKNAEYNERYAQLMVKVVPPAAAKAEIEKLVKQGAASSKTKELLKELYVAEKKSDKGYTDYLAKLEMAAKVKKREELAKTMMNEEAPKFSLKDLEGNDISLAGLKGKVVIVDFWATWCGPCIASMPAMKTVLEQLKKREDVTFVFVDTWESVENKKQNAADFMKNKNYPFHVLLDETDKVVADFKVSGIPTKFVIDKIGNIRFKSVGFGGNDDELIDEVNMMVELASADMPVKKYVK